MNLKEKNIIVFTGPSGSGKTTLINRLINEYPSKFCYVPSHTSRPRRENEIDGKDYYFRSLENIQKDLDENNFFVYTKYCGNLYGLSKVDIEKEIQNGKVCLEPLDFNGINQLRKCGYFKPLYLYIKPPCIDELEKRMEIRGETKENLRKRLCSVESEMENLDNNIDLFDHCIINDDINRAYNDLKNILKQY